MSLSLRVSMSVCQWVRCNSHLYMLIWIDQSKNHVMIFWFYRIPFHLIKSDSDSALHHQTNLLWKINDDKSSSLCSKLVLIMLASYWTALAWPQPMARHLRILLTNDSNRKLARIGSEFEYCFQIVTYSMTNVKLRWLTFTLIMWFWLIISISWANQLSELTEII